MSKKISELNELISVDSSDVFPVVDVSANETKKVTSSNLKTSLSLDNVDNTSDANKPVSTATQSALDNKVAKDGDVMTGSLSIDLSAPGSVQTTDLDGADIYINYTDTSLNLQVSTSLEPGGIGYHYSDSTVDNYISITGSDGQISLYEIVNSTTTPRIPTSPEHVTTKQYVDSGVNSKQDALGFVPENSANKNVSNGYAGIDSSGKIPVTLLPASLMNLHGQWNAATNTPALADHGIGDDVGDVYECVVAGTVDFGHGAIEFFVGDWAVYGNDGHWYRSPNSNAVTSVNGYTGSIVLTKSDVGLSNVNNTSDLDKPVSTATQSALDLKADTSSVYAKTEVFTKTESNSNYEPKNFNIQAHIASMLNPHSVTKAQVGLGSVDNTSDLDKPVSTATQSALDLKAPLASPALTGTPTAPTPSTSDNSSKIATTAYVKNVVSSSSSGTPASSAISALDIDWSLSETYYKAISAASTFTFSNIADGKTITVILTNATATAYSITFPLTQQETFGLQKTLFANSSNIYIFTRVNGVTYCNSLSEVK